MKKHYFLSVLALGMILSGCSTDVKRAMGVIVTPPDEFAVMSHAPLSVPKDFSLPAPSAPRLSINDGSAVREEAKQALFSGRKVPAQRSKGEKVLVTKVGVTPDEDIRLILAEEYARSKEEKKSGLGRITNMFSWLDKDEDVINAAAERKRIQQSLSDGTLRSSKEKPGS